MLSPLVAASARDVPSVDLSLDRLEQAPLEVWAELRADAPVAFVPVLGLTVLTRFDDVDRAVRDTECFAAETPDGPLTRTLGPNFMHADGTAHRKVRDLLVPTLRAKGLRETHEAWLRDRAGELAAAVAGRPQADLVADYAHPLAVALLTRLTGVVADAETYESWFRGIAGGISNFEGDARKEAAALAVGAEIDEAVRRTAGLSTPPGLVGLMVAAGCSPAEISSTVKLFVIGGLQEPRDLLGFCVLGLVESGGWVDLPAALDRLPMAIEEAARWGSPVGTVTRTVRQEATVAGHRLAAGTRVAAVLASANHDPARWSHPERFDPARAEGSHWAYGTGPHTCVGAVAARFLVRIAMEELLPHVPALRIVGPTDIRGYEFRGPTRVLVQTGEQR